MEDLRCSNPLTSHFLVLCNSPSTAEFQTNRPSVSQLAFPPRLFLPLLSSPHYLKPTRLLARPHDPARPLAFHLRTHALQAQQNTTSTQTTSATEGNSAFIRTDRPPTQNSEALSRSNEQLLPIPPHTPCPDAPDANTLMDASKMSSEMLQTDDPSTRHVSTSEMPQTDDPSNTQKVHPHNDRTHANSELGQAQNKERILKRKGQRHIYLFAALASSIGITSLAGASVYYRFAWQMEGGEVPWTEMFGTFSLALGAAVGMEYWARWAHRALWHASLWSMHKSHHQARDGPFELNDVFAIINAAPAIALMSFGFLNKGLVPGLCFGAGLGITVFGMAYMFVHDGLVHRRFPVGPIADVPYFQRVAAAHQLHHADTFNGVPYGLFLGPMELKEIGGQTELEKVLQKRKREKTSPIQG